MQAADVLQLARLANQVRIARDRGPIAMLLTVRDERVSESPPALAEAVGAALERQMKHVYPRSVLLEVDIGIADHGADA